MAYNWTAANTPQGRERLKELMDLGIEVIGRGVSKRVNTPPNAITIFKKEDDGYRIYLWKQDWDDCYLDGIEFLDPSPEPRPSEGLLRQAHERGALWNSFECPQLSMEDDFVEWIATLPADPLVADKASIQTEFANGLERKLIDAHCTGDAIAAIKRFAGVEVSNG